MNTAKLFNEARKFLIAESGRDYPVWYCNGVDDLTSTQQAILAALKKIAEKYSPSIDESFWMDVDACCSLEVSSDSSLFGKMVLKPSEEQRKERLRRLILLERKRG